MSPAGTAREIAQQFVERRQMSTLGCIARGVAVATTDASTLNTATAITCALLLCASSSKTTSPFFQGSCSRSTRAYGSIVQTPPNVVAPSAVSFDSTPACATLFKANIDSSHIDAELPTQDRRRPHAGSHDHRDIPEVALGPYNACAPLTQLTISGIYSADTAP